MIQLRPVDSPADLETWAQLKSTVVPNEPVTAAQIVATDEEGRLLLLSELDGVPVGCGIAAPSHFGGRAFVAARVLPQYRRRGVGSALVRALSEHARGLGRDGINCFVYSDEPHSLAFVEQLGLVEVDYQLEQRRVIGAESPADVPAGLEIAPLAGRREELLRTAWDAVAVDAYRDLPLPGEVTFTLEEWLREEATRPEGSFVALEDGAVVGYAGLLEHANGSATAEHGLTAVRRDRRRRGIARALKQTQLHWAARNGVVELVTWTQRGNEAMQAVNRGLGYLDRSKVITYQGPLPTP
ncbi:MAG: hypothetical protein QOH95_1514 [Gaiellaceae bacterium]|nr:hypothetical protein [Gaiellaceae bacterium]